MEETLLKRHKFVAILAGINAQIVILQNTTLCTSREETVSSDLCWNYSSAMLVTTRKSMVPQSIEPVLLSLLKTKINLSNI